LIEFGPVNFKRAQLEAVIDYCRDGDVVLYMMGREAHDTLKASMREHRVRFREPRKRAPLSPERRAQLVAQLAYAREQRSK
jgi:hypothetical protein